MPTHPIVPSGWVGRLSQRLPLRALDFRDTRRGQACKELGSTTSSSPAKTGSLRPARRHAGVYLASGLLLQSRPPPATARWTLQQSRPPCGCPCLPWEHQRFLQNLWAWCTACQASHAFRSGRSREISGGKSLDSWIPYRASYTVLRLMVLLKSETRPDAQRKHAPGRLDESWLRK